MGILKDKQFTEWGNHTFEVRACNHIFQGLLYRLFLDGTEVANARNFWKVPTQQRLEAQLSIDGEDHHLVLWVKQRWLTSEFSLLIDDHQLTLQRVF